MSQKRRVEKVEEALNVDKEELQPLVVILGAWNCPLEEKKQDKCKIFQEKEKEALAKKPGEFKGLATVILDCQDKCPYAPTGKGGKSK